MISSPYPFQEAAYKHRSNQRHSSQIANLDIPEGYYPEDITVDTVGKLLYVKGRHVCSCDENCFEREFERRLSLPNNVDTQSLSAALHPNGKLSINGVKYKQVIRPVDTLVPVEGFGLTQRQSDFTSCGKSKVKKSGFKLKKMNARTGEIMDDIEPIQVQYVYESEIDDDGLTIEVVP